MNREQMIAWLMLEGWEPVAQNNLWWPGVYKDGCDVFYDVDRNEVRRTYITSPRERPVTSWDKVRPTTLEKLFYFIEEKDHGKLE